MALSVTTWQRSRQVMLFLALAAVCLLLALSGRAAPHADEKMLSLTDAKALLLELINRDRSALGRRAVQIDKTAEAVAQRQSEEMVKMDAMSHADSSGRLPVQRYTDVGGVHSIRENVVCFSVRPDLAQPLESAAEPVFSRAEVEAIEAAYFNEVAPNDGHRKNILRAEHTHVGIGLARGTGDDAPVIANAEEFVDRYIEKLDPIPHQATAGDSITISGAAGSGRHIVAIGIARGKIAETLDRAGFRAMSHYSVPAPYAKYWTDRSKPNVRFNLGPDGQFKATVPLDDSGRAGLYYVSIWVNDLDRGDVLASVRTVVVTLPERASHP